MEDFLGIIVGLAVFSAVVYGFMWTAQKYVGIRFHGRYQAGEAFQQSIAEEQMLESYKKTNPDLVKQAIERCKAKHFAITHGNVLDEITKLLNSKSSIATSSIKGKPKSSISNRFSNLSKEQIEFLKLFSKPTADKTMLNHVLSSSAIKALLIQLDDLDYSDDEKLYHLRNQLKNGEISTENFENIVFHIKMRQQS